MILSLQKFFDRLQRDLDRLKTQRTVDNEAMRHDLLVRPLLKCALGWNDHELHSQQTVYSPVADLYDVNKSHILRPDIIIVPEGFEHTAAIVEEKRGQKHIHDLMKHIEQLRNYQSALNVVWGLLTDGEKWILQRNYETHFAFNSIDELRRGIHELQECIGKENILRRFSVYKTMDLIIIPRNPRLFFDPEVLDLQIRRDPNWIPLPLLQQDFIEIENEGFVPVPVIVELLPIPGHFPGLD